MLNLDWNNRECSKLYLVKGKTMNDYTGKVCPYCKTAFKPGDEIVVCSECDMPHHKDCWIENRGCTTFGCTGTIQSADSDDSSVTAREMKFEDARHNAEEAVYCTKCGVQNKSTSLFCPQCGNRLSTSVAAQAPTSQQTNHLNTSPYAYVNQQGATYYQGGNNTCFSCNNTETDADIQKLVGVKSEYYIPQFQEMRAQNKKNTWNWSAFLIAPYWMIYRKMYTYGATVLGISFVLSLLGASAGYLLPLCGHVALGVFGNYIYMSFLEKKAVQVKAMNEPYRTQFIAQNSGTSPTAAILTAAGYSFLIAILSL